MNVLISAVICTHNRSGYLVKAIQSLVEQSLAPENYEIIVVDNCSTDDTKDIVEAFVESHSIQYIYESRLGLCHARNTGWQHARGQYVAYLDDDAIACPDWLENIIVAFSIVTPRPGCIGGMVKPIWEKPRPIWLPDHLALCLTVLDWSDTPGVIADLSQQWLAGANIAFPKAVLEQLGGFVAGLGRVGKNLLSGDDIFLEKQIMQAGYSCFYDPRIAVYHHVHASRLAKRWFIDRYYWQGISDAIMQVIEESPSPQRCLHLAILKTLRLLRSHRKLSVLLIPTNHPGRFADKCFVLIEVGYIVGLLKASNQ